jgi:diguanylate cyclase (GGDEF)-like protein
MEKMMDKIKIDAEMSELKKLYILQNVSLESIKGLLEACSVRMLAPQEILITPKEPNKTVFFILSGQLRIHLDSLESESFETLDPGESVGEMSVIDNQLTSAFVVANEACKLLAMDEDVLWSLIQASHAAACNLLFILAKRLRHTNSIVVEGVQLEQDFLHYGSFDALTGLHNRYWFNSMFRRQFIRSSINNKPFSVIMADIDDFKQLNDTYGHLTGDQVLYEVAHTITKNIRPAEMVCRYGGDEFIILLPDEDIETARLMAERLFEAMRKALPIPCGDNDIFHPTLSMGLAEMKSDQTPEILINTADEAMCRAKENGGNCYSE